MTTLTIRTDKPESEIRLYHGSEQLAYVEWQAHRQLAETIHLKIRELIESEERRLKDVEGVVVYKGPGSFTGLRIGISVANAFADSLRVPIVASTGDDWITVGEQRLANGDNERHAQPEYGSPPHITQPKH